MPVSNARRRFRYKNDMEYRERRQRLAKAHYLTAKAKITRREYQVRRNELYKLKKAREPWNYHLYAAIARCQRHPCYFGKGIKCFLTKEQIKELWFRDKAYAMKRPSIDRIDSKRDYTFDNCRFLEHEDNCGKPFRKSVVQYSLSGKNIREYSSINEAVISNGFSGHSNISNCARGKISTAYGFKWKYAPTL